MRNNFLMTRLIIVAAFLIFTKTAFTQIFDSTHYKKNVVYFETIGNIGIGFFSFNYERRMIELKHGFIGVRGGIGLAAATALVNYVNRKERESHFEVGVGISSGLMLQDKLIDPYFTGPTASLMYRYQRPSGKFIFRAGWTPVLYPDPIARFIFLLIDFGGSIGYVF